MKVQLHHNGWAAVSARIPELHRERAVEHRVTQGSKHHIYELPALAWRQILDALTETSYGDRGGKVKENPQSLYTAISRIAASVAMREHHPALFGRAVRGAQVETIPVWAASVGRLSPYPARLPDANGALGDEVRAGRFMVLTPTVTLMQGHQLTEWSTRGRVFDHWLHDEASHLEFDDYKPTA